MELMLGSRASAGEHLEAQVRQAAFAVEAVGQLDVLGQAGGADLDQPIPLFAQFAHLLQERLHRNGLESLVCCVAHFTPFVVCRGRAPIFLQVNPGDGRE